MRCLRQNNHRALRILDAFQNLPHLANLGMHVKTRIEFETKTRSIRRCTFLYTTFKPMGNPSQDRPLALVTLKDQCRLPPLQQVSDNCFFAPVKIEKVAEQNIIQSSYAALFNRVGRAQVTVPARIMAAFFHMIMIRRAKLYHLLKHLIDVFGNRITNARVLLDVQEGFVFHHLQIQKVNEPRDLSGPGQKSGKRFAAF